jgi:hypothetical protein
MNSTVASAFNRFMTVAAAMACVGAIACVPSHDETVVGERALRPELDIMRPPRAFSQCPKDINSKLSPEQQERPSQKLRKLSNGQYIPLNAECYARAYSPAELKTWSDSGDPVAVLALAYLSLEKTSGSCDSTLPIADLLSRTAYSQLYKTQSSSRIRVPETLAVAAIIYKRCNRLEQSELALKSAIDNGYTYIVPVE